MATKTETLIHGWTVAQLVEEYAAVPTRELTRIIASNKAQIASGLHATNVRDGYLVRNQMMEAVKKARRSRRAA
jgi:hypothetical protein